MNKEGAEINCVIFQKQEKAITDNIYKINMAKRMQEKVMFAEELKKEAEVLLLCPDYNDKIFNCKKCRFIADLRKRTAGLIIKAKKLA
ncbi:MAG: hypothetical protein V1752_07520 [Candidatus Firestonebacteria bacterium]